ncbi:MAG TPA: alkaline phosphatase family protein [Ktedonobacteraceae bacterium]
MKRRKLLGIGLVLFIVSILSFSVSAAASAHTTVSTAPSRENGPQTTTPIKHLIVLFQENVSFDHYFGTYPFATNPAGEPRFVASPNTPTVNGLTPALLSNNPNAANPQLLSRSQALTCDQDHSYTDEQKAFDHGLMDKFVENVSGVSCTDRNIVMDYYDGNTVTALWNYAQHFAMSDNSFGTNFGPSTVGAENLIAGQTYGATPANLPGAVSNGTIIGDPRPAYDDCSKGATVALSGKNVGDLLNAQNITWGWFQGGFAPSAVANGVATCGTAHTNIGGSSVTDYIPHHEPFQYYLSTSNPHHLSPSSPLKIGQTDQANHQYDLTDFWTAFNHGYLPAVSFLKAPGYQDGHAGYSDPLDEQTFLVSTLNKLQQSSFWKDTAVVINYDDSDGWYDHAMPTIVNQSSDPTDALTGPGACGTAKAGAFPARCGYGPRLPLLVISPFAKKNFVDSSLTDQSSILRFIEDNWKLGRIGNQSFDALAGSLNNLFSFRDSDQQRLILDSQTGERV